MTEYSLNFKDYLTTGGMNTVLANMYTDNILDLQIRFIFFICVL